jgi:hypothetical protein
MTNWGDFEKWLSMTPDERDEAITELLANTAEPWLDSNENALVMGMISATRALWDAATEYSNQVAEDSDKQANRYIAGLYAHAYSQMMSNFATLTGLSDVKRSMK